MWENSVMSNSKMWLELGAIYVVRVVQCNDCSPGERCVLFLGKID